MKRIIAAVVTVFLLWANIAYAGSTGSEKLIKSSSSSANECFEGFSRAMFSFNQAIDATVFEPIAKGYRVLPMVIRNGSSNVMNNISHLLSIPIIISKEILQELVIQLLDLQSILQLEF